MTITKGTAIAGENGDRKITVGGRAWRVRVRKLEELPTGAPMNSGAGIPSAIGVVVSVAALDGSGEVGKDATGRFLVFDPETITFQKENLERAEFDPEAEILALVEKHILAAEKQLGSRDKIPIALSAWGDPNTPPIRKSSQTPAFVR